MMTAKKLPTTTIADLFDKAQLQQLGISAEDAAIGISGVTQDSRTVQAGMLFIACKGHALDGRDFVESAIEAGAAAALVELGDGWQSNNRLCQCAGYCC